MGDQGRNWILLVLYLEVLVTIVVTVSDVFLLIVVLCSYFQMSPLLSFINTSISASSLLYVLSFPISSLFFSDTLRNSVTASVATDCASYCYYQGIWLWWPLMSQQTDEERNQRRSSNSPSLQMEVSLLLWSAICLWSDSSTVWVWKGCRHWVINATKCFPNVARNGAAG